MIFGRAEKPTKIKKIIYIAMLVFLAAAPDSAGAYDWPGGAALAQKIQAVKEEIANARELLFNSRSKTKISAAAYAAVDLSTGAVLLRKNPDQAYSIASITKLMTAVIARENIDTGKTITLTRKMLASEGKSPSIYAGLNISIENLLQASLTQSVNDAAESLAYSYGKDRFLNLMNQKAKELKMTKTVYCDVHGLAKKNRSTATDLVKLLSYTRKNHPDVLAITKQNNFWMPDQKGVLLKFKNMNDFYDTPGFVGGKTGYLPEAKQTFAAIFNIKNKPTAIVILHSDNYQADTFKILNQLKNQ